MKNCATTTPPVHRSSPKDPGPSSNAGFDWLYQYWPSSAQSEELPPPLPEPLASKWLAA